MSSQNGPFPWSRRSFLQLSAASGVTAWRVMTEPMLAQAAASAVPASSAMTSSAMTSAATTSAIWIDQNENPLGPCPAARQAVTAMAAQGGRYFTNLTDDFEKSFAESVGLKKEFVSVFPGSSGPLHHSVLAFTSSSRSYVTADPGYEAGMFAANASGARIVKVPLTKTYAHDVKAMIAAAPDAGMFYVCSPNNPTGTLTPHADIEHLLANKPKGSIVVVDEAYIHFVDTPSVVDLVQAGKDIVVLRTFSKLYGMAGLRCGAAIAKPDLLARIQNIMGWNAMPTTAVAAATASMADPRLIPARRHINAEIRGEVFQWLDQHGYFYIPSESNFFMLNTKQPAKAVIDAMAKRSVRIGRIWPILPTYSRITVGTREEMAMFRDAWQEVMKGTVRAQVGGLRVAKPWLSLDGIRFRA
jgi:histidinol-phosphate aminotransferase